MMRNREKLKSIFTEALSSVLPGNLVRETLKVEGGDLKIEGKSYRLSDYRNIHVFGSGKASIETARAVKAVLGDRVTDGIVVSNYDGKEYPGGRNPH
jgi:glycerate 2-kinase